MGELSIDIEKGRQEDLRAQLSQCLEEWANAGMNPDMEVKYTAAKELLGDLPDAILPVFDARMYFPEIESLKQDPYYAPGFREARALMDLAQAPQIRIVDTPMSARLIVRGMEAEIENYVSSNAQLMGGRYSKVGSVETIEMPVKAKWGK